MDIKTNLYGIYCPITNELKYVGVTSRKIETRLHEHMRNPSNIYMCEWIKYLMENNLTPEIKLINIYNTYNEALKIETHYIKNNINLLNVLVDGIKGYMVGKTHTLESKQKISKKLKGIIRSKEILDKINGGICEFWSDDSRSLDLRKRKSELMIGNTHNYGFTHTEEFKEKKRLSMLGNKLFLDHKHSEVTKSYISKINTGKNNPMYGKKMSKTCIERRSKLVKQLGTFKGKNNPNFKYDIKKEDITNMVSNGLTVKDISIKYGCSLPIVRKKLKEYCLTIEKRCKYDLCIDDIRKYLSDGLNMKQIGSLYGCTNKVISKYIKKHDK